MRLKVFYLLFVFFTCIGSFRAAAQDTLLLSSKIKVLSFDLMPVGYAGDLSSFTQWGSGFGVSLHTLKDKKLSRGVAFMTGNLRGNNPDFITETEAVPNRSFQTRFFALHYDWHYNFIKTDNFNLFAGAGIGLMYFVVKDDSGKRLSSQFGTRNKGEDYANLTLVLPVKIGADYFFENGIGVGFRVGLLNPRTKYLDNIGELGKNKRDNALFAKFCLQFRL